jgi:sugar (pentulose or hexulose) kinase
MMQPRHIAVIDIGKTNAKLALVDLANLTEIAIISRPNLVLPGPPWPHFDVEGHWAFLLAGLQQFHSDYRIDAICVTTHGASVALLDADGNLAAPILDYEYDGPADIAAEYDKIRPPFSQTGSPRLANGLNVGAQLHWQFMVDPGLYDRTATVMTYPQFWAHRLTGVAACDVTSIGCHTDLWEPYTAQFSDLVARLGIADKIAPIRRPGDILGKLRPQIARATSLPASTPVACGIHDSNASLYPHILTQSGPFAVVSTGTWVIVMAMQAADVALDPARDTLVNVNALGDPVPSARFMGGREFEIIQNGHPFVTNPSDAQQVLADDVMLLPAVDPSTGPFQGRQMRWLGDAPAEGSGVRAVALSYYLALMTQTLLLLTGARGATIVEGPLARNAHFLAMLAAATARPVLCSQSTTGTSIGAALLCGASGAIASPTAAILPADMAPLAAYAAKWQSQVERQERNKK